METAKDYRRNAVGPQNNRSAVSNGKLLPIIDGRSATARRFKDLYRDIIADLGGFDHLSEGQRQLVRRAAMLSAECERLEAMACVDGGALDCEVYGMLTDRLGRLFQRLGLKRVAKDALTLRGYLAERGKDRELDNEAAE